MASKRFLSLVLLFVLVGSASCGIGPPAFVQITGSDIEIAEFLSKFAVQQYNKINDVPHLEFIRFVDGEILTVAGRHVEWLLQVKVQNCTQPADGSTEALYHAAFSENFDAPDVQAYNSNFALRHFFKIG